MLETWVQGSLRPDITLLLDLPVADGLMRAGKRSEPDRFEREKESFFNRVRNCYLEIARASPERVHVIDATPRLPDVQVHIEQLLREFIQVSTRA